MEGYSEKYTIVVWNSLLETGTEVTVTVCGFYLKGHSKISS